MDYTCDCCDYKTNYKRNYDRHLQSKKHICIYSATQMNQNIDIINNTNHICTYCKKSFQHAKNLGKHLKSCINKKQYDQDNEYEKTLKLLTDELKFCKQENIHYKQEIEHYKEDVKHYERDNEYYKILLNNAGGMLKKSISSLSYIVNNFKNAPVIKSITINDIDNKDFKDNKKVIRQLIHNYKHKVLHEYLGNHIIDVYKKQDPNELTLISLRSAHYIRI